MFPASEIILNVLFKEYEYERDRKGKLESKAGILFTLLIAIQSFLVAKIKFPEKVKFEKIEVLTTFTIVIILVVILVILFIVALYNLIKVMKLSEYKQIEIKDFNRELCEFPIDTINVTLIEKYRDTLLHNRNQNDMKSKYFQVSIYCVLGILISTALIYLITWFVF